MGVKFWITVALAQPANMGMDVQSRGIANMIAMGVEVGKKYCKAPYFYFVDYGCCCGIGADEYEPIDAYDRVCMNHDRCWEGLKAGSDPKCSVWSFRLNMLRSYDWEAIYHEETHDFTITCKEEAG